MATSISYDIICGLERAANAASQQHKDALAAHLWQCINDLNGVEGVLQQVDDAESDLVWAMQHGMANEHSAAAQQREMLLASLPKWLAKGLQYEWLSPRMVLASAMQVLVAEQIVY